MMLPSHSLLHARLSTPQEILRGCERPGRDKAEGERGHGRTSTCAETRTTKTKVARVIAGYS
eukprot:scaffold14737_cov68-Phaeocystis_antarctica.AAC.4